MSEEPKDIIRPTDRRDEFDGKVAIVTGSSAGIGLATAQVLSQRGGLVVVNGRGQDAVDRAVKLISSRGGRAHAFVGDVSDPTTVDLMVGQTLERFGAIDVLVNNAGVPQASATEDLDWSEWARVIQANLSGAFLCAQRVGRAMLARKGGVIVNVTSILGHVGLPGRAAYCSSKHGLEGLTKVLAAEWAHRGVRVCSVAPGYVATALVQTNVDSGALDASAVEGRTPAGRMAGPEEIAQTIAFVASDAAAYMYGPSAIIDGGWLSYGGWGDCRSISPSPLSGEKI